MRAYDGLPVKEKRLTELSLNGPELFVFAVLFAVPCLLTLSAMYWGYTELMYPLRDILQELQKIRHTLERLAQHQG